MPLDLRLLRTLRPQNTFHHFTIIGSTMTEAAQFAATGAPHGTVVLAEEQTSGMGRLGRSWISQAELGIYCSILLRLQLSQANLPLASLLLGLATAEAIQQATQLSCDLRWPNDVLINERKVAGILTHLVDDCILGGIGINVNQVSFDSDLRTPATSLLLESNRRVQSREILLAYLLESIDSFCSLLASSGPDAVLRSFASASSYAMGRRVVVEETGTRGVTAGLDDSGFLLVRADSGVIEKVSTGALRPDR